MAESTNTKIYSTFKSFQQTLKVWKENNETIVFTNGCFDIIHHGHVDSLQKSAELGTKLIVGLNSDSSVGLIKGKKRPIFSHESRAIILAAFSFVDAVIIFQEETPNFLIQNILPNILTKGEEYQIHEIEGHDIVFENGGKVKTLRMVSEISTSEIINRIKALD
jgi:rfaE bifunctional protein nucleotidyltransferase chain/domain